MHSLYKSGKIVIYKNNIFFAFIQYIINFLEVFSTDLHRVPSSVSHPSRKCLIFSDYLWVCLWVLQKIIYIITVHVDVDCLQVLNELYPCLFITAAFCYVVFLACLFVIAEWAFYGIPFIFSFL